MTRVLDEAAVRYELLPHAHTQTATVEAEALGLAAADVAKTLAVNTPHSYLRAVLRASQRLDLRKLREFLGAGRHKVPRNGGRSSARLPEFEFGAVPPVGGGRRDPVIMDSRLSGRASLVLEPGSHEESVRVAADDLVRVAGAQLADICED